MFTALHEHVFFSSSSLLSCSSDILVCIRGVPEWGTQSTVQFGIPQGKQILVFLYRFILEINGVASTRVLNISQPDTDTNRSLSIKRRHTKH